ncbi:MAG: M23 family metallopeptidase [Proteobacteria bacterium]|jgi:murein DD-endopeptidase MepM/ murein hydrolase activator NlpD|nr:M23 family metallopeptidase [Pseudomonadota bacterium]
MRLRSLLLVILVSALAVGASAALAAGKPEPAGHQRARARAERLGLGTRVAASALLRGEPEARWASAAGGGKDRLPGTLRWPVAKGWFVRGFGSGENGRHLAVDIAGQTGWNVRAAADGIVGYADDGVKGYGNLVMIVHSGGVVTLYGHNSKLKVAAGQLVARGDVIAEVGSTGISRGPHVHFEMLYGGLVCDPLPLFRPGVRHRDGHMSPLPRAIWRRPTRRPDAVECRPRHGGSKNGEAESP